MSKARRGEGRLAEKILPTLSIGVFLLAWQLFVDIRHIPPIYLPSPVAIVRALWDMIEDGSLFYNLGATLLRIMVGFLLAAVIGVIVGVIMGMSRLFERIADPWIAALYPLPKISLIPLLIIWLGTGEAYKIVISAVTAFFPIVMSTYAGVRQVDRGLVKTAEDLGANRCQVQLHVVLPGAIPTIFAGLQLGMGVTIILVVAAEMVGGSSTGGMGNLLIQAGQVLETEKVFAALVVLTLMGAVIIKGQQWLDRRLAPWANLI
jgi:ABC-type nitrate/sulfonate/bicarbonate transport system permease component